jgi:hypothetical protein
MPFSSKPKQRAFDLPSFTTHHEFCEPQVCLSKSLVILSISFFFKTVCFWLIFIADSSFRFLCMEVCRKWDFMFFFSFSLNF